MQHAVEQVCAEAQRALGFEPGLRIVGDLSVLDGDEIRDHLVMALRESLANVARHARASRVDAEIRVTPDQVKLIVEDDGRGIAANGVMAPGSVRALSASRPAVRSGGDGLGNLEQRARLLGGRCAVRNGVPRGTVVDWTVPLRLQLAPNGAAADGQHSGEASSDATSASLT
jgi:signal transduction histidine kinase